MTSTAYPPQPRGAVPLGRRFKRWMLARPGVARLGVIVLLFIAWEIAARFFVDKIFLSPPSPLFTQSFHPTQLLVLISILAAMAILLNEIVRRAELHYSRWRSD